jgi:hypothetical protein
MKKFLLIAVSSIAILSFNVQADSLPWSKLNAEKNQTVEQHCTVVHIMAELIMEIRQLGSSLANDIKDKSPIDKAITISAYDKPLWSTESNKKKAASEFANKWMMKCLKEHPQK